MREYGTGSIITDNTKSRYIARYKDELGTTHRKIFPLTKQGKQQAEMFLKNINRQKEQQISVASDITLGEWLLQYIKLYKVPNLRTRSLQRVRDCAIKWEPLYNIQLKLLRPALIQNRLIELKNEGLSPSSIKKIQGLLKAALKQAVAEQLMLHNPVDAVPSIKQRKPKIEVFTKRELGLIFHALRKLKKNKMNNSQRYDMILFFRLLLTTGVRVSELLALEWKNISDKDIHITQTKSGISTQEFNDPKTFAGERYIPFLSPKTKKLLFEKPRTKYVFQNKNGGAMNYQRAFLTWNNVRKMTGITKNIHVFRHTFASFMLAYNKKPLAEVSHILGHANPAITLEIYTHFVNY